MKRGCRNKQIGEGRVSYQNRIEAGRNRFEYIDSSLGEIAHGRALFAPGKMLLTTPKFRSRNAPKVRSVTCATKHLVVSTFFNNIIRDIIIGCDMFLNSAAATSKQAELSQAASL